jgi:hypothetical protein
MKWASFQCGQVWYVFFSWMRTRKTNFTISWMDRDLVRRQPKTSTKTLRPLIFLFSFCSNIACVCEIPYQIIGCFRTSDNPVESQMLHTGEAFRSTTRVFSLTLGWSESPMTRSWKAPPNERIQRKWPELPTELPKWHPFSGLYQTTITIQPQINGHLSCSQFGHWKVNCCIWGWIENHRPLAGTWTTFSNCLAKIAVGRHCLHQNEILN